jgi:hypothetical protein
MVSQAWYAVLRHRRGNPDTRFAVTYSYREALSPLAEKLLLLYPLYSTRRRHSCAGGRPWVPEAHLA